MLARVGREWEPPVPISTAEWLEEYLYLPAESADLPGRYSLHYVPAMEGILAAWDDPACIEVDVQKSAQQAYTTTLLGYLLKRIDADPGPMVGLFSADEAAKEFVDEKLTPTVLATPRLRRKLDVTKTRSAGNRALFKKFAGGFLKLGGSRSIHKVKSTPASLVFVEEPDDATENLKQQGDAIRLLWERTKRRRRAKRLMGGTPSVAGLSRIEEHVEQSDKRVLPIACHDCGDKHVLDFAHVVWVGKDGDAGLTGEEHPVYGRQQPDTAVYVCPHCGSPWDDYQRKENIRDTVRSAREAGDPLRGWVATAPFHGIAGFHELNELYSCLPGVGMADLVRDYLAAEHKAERGDENDKIVFVNSKLGRPYEFRGDEVTADALRAKAEDYPEGIVPSRAFLITAGVDVQHDSLYVVIRAWAPGEECWLIVFVQLFAAQTTALKQDPVWDALDDTLFRGFAHELGGRLNLSAVTIDAGDGNTSDAVYDWVRTRSARHRDVLIMAGKGSSERTDPEIFSLPRTEVDHRNPKRRTKADKHGVRVFIVGTSKAKDWISARIGLAGDGPERMHVYADVRDDYYDQVTAEVKAPHRRLRRRVWQLKSGRENHAGDCEVYCLHAARAKRVHLLRPGQWQALEAQVRQPDLLGAAPTAEAVDRVPRETPDAANEARPRFRVKRKARH